MRSAGKPAPTDAQELISDLRALLRLEAVTPGPNAPRIALIRERLAALGIPDPTLPTTPTVGA